VTSKENGKMNGDSRGASSAADGGLFDQRVAFRSWPFLALLVRHAFTASGEVGAPVS
jgi:hypothetical protein